MAITFMPTFYWLSDLRVLMAHTPGGALCFLDKQLALSFALFQ